MVDNQSVIAGTKNSVNHGRTKHIKARFHAIRQREKEGEVHLQYCLLQVQLLDLFTKPLAKACFEELKHQIGVLNGSFKEEIEG